MSTPTLSPASSVALSPTTPAASPYQEKLINWCRSLGGRAPSFQILSDRRGGRTAWSCQVSVGGQNIQARFWYDGQYVNNAREDAAECALQFFGQLPSPQGPQPRHLQQQQQRGYGAVSS
ncbi:hypothetical protein B0A48_09317 [Cryoendolithus antarcticus]|uniref:DRBM domain-containing protein n=1 Tax=Cryoendolithus antarcticus TaxID=1507870 RepID=A0A1V8T2B7_9PEZI|nr:hypothetical protein B0A48_09317 [Cryoendolithus antarcticus]